MIDAILGLGLLFVKAVICGAGFVFGALMTWLLGENRLWKFTWRKW